jgi:hypothetical protein
LGRRRQLTGRTTAGRIGVCALAAALTLLAGSSAALARTSTGGSGSGGAGAQPYKGRVGAASHTIWYRSGQQLASLKRARRSGLTWVREDFAWGAFERRPGVWDWSIGDTFMRNLSRAGLDVLPVIAYSPGWAASGPTIYHPPRNFGAYANFCKQLARRYGVGGTFWAKNPGLAPRPLRSMEIWNEPWHESYWRPQPDPAAYARLVRASAVAVRSVDPDIKILASADIFQYVTGKTGSGRC